MKYLYSFVVWPSETWGFGKALFMVFKATRIRMDEVFEEEEFEAFRSMLNHDGFTLREIERVPYHEPEIVL